MADHSDTPVYQQHHFESMQQQSQSTLMGMWLFLAQEIMFFGGLFAAYTVYRNLYPEAYAAGAATMNWKLGCFNTVVLIGSSLTMVLAVHAARLGSKQGIIKWMLATMVLGSIFLGVKVVEYKAKWDHHLVPGAHFDFQAYLDAHHAEEAAGHAAAPLHAAKGHHAEEVGHAAPAVPKGIQIFYSLYFVMTGMHAFHMIIGIGVAIWILMLTAKNTFSAEYFPHVDYFGLYWHFVDIVWIFLFPLLYLI